MYYGRFDQLNGLKPGDVIIGPKSEIGIVKHFVVFRGFDHLGNAVYMDNNVRLGVRVMSEAQFLQENQPSGFRRFLGSEFQRLEAIKRADSMYGYPYNIEKFNCEHFANYVQFGTVSSEQVNNVTNGLGLALASFLGFGMLFSLFK